MEGHGQGKLMEREEEVYSTVIVGGLITLLLFHIIFSWGELE